MCAGRLYFQSGRAILPNTLHKRPTDEVMLVEPGADDVVPAGRNMALETLVHARVFPFKVGVLSAPFGNELYRSAMRDRVGSGRSTKPTRKLQ